MTCVSSLSSSSSSYCLWASRKTTSFGIRPIVATASSRSSSALRKTRAPMQSTKVRADVALCPATTSLGKSTIAATRAPKALVSFVNYNCFPFAVYGRMAAAAEP